MTISFYLGLSSGGLGQSDIGKSDVIGGFALEFYERNRHKYMVDIPLVNLDPSSYYKHFTALILTDYNTTSAFRMSTMVKLVTDREKRGEKRVAYRSAIAT